MSFKNRTSGRVIEKTRGKQTDRQTGPRDSVLNTTAKKKVVWLATK